VKLVHLSDLHLGHRAFDRQDRGVNLRERDISLAFHRALEQVVRLAPDLVVITGDVFDRPDPSPAALVSLTRGLESLRGALPDTPVHLVAGARDTPRRSGDNGALAAMDAFPHVEAATSIPRNVIYRERSLHVQLLPHRAVLRGPHPVTEPDPRARWNVLVAYGRVSTGEGPGLHVDASGWDYVALGSEHGYRALTPRVVHAGALERVGPAPWREAGEEKGFVVADLDEGTHRFHPVPGRPVVALAPTRAPRDAPAALRARFAEVVREIPGGIAGKIVRVRLRGPTPSDLMELAEVLPEADRQAVHLSVEVDDPGGGIRPESADSLAERARASLPDDAPEGTAALLDQLLVAGESVPGGRGG
jgi:DNA repair exonuclease SbcCD nuclease subunit